jgi:SPP1 gp7 family putative phage head morphogenesis protein
MNKDRWKLKQRLEQSYQRALSRLLNKIYLNAESVNPAEFIANVQKIVRSTTFKQLAQKLATNMVLAVNVDNKRTWREAAAESMQGKKAYKLLQNEMKGRVGGDVQRLIERNANIIKTLPLDVSYKVTDYVKEQSLKGKRASDIAEEIKVMFPHKSAASSKTIARTETSKTSTALTRSRAQSRGDNWYIWNDSNDGRVRSSHAHMDGVLVNWNDPPAPEVLIGEKSEGHYHAGEIWNCRCYAQPVVFLQYVSFPRKVYYNNQIVMMTRAQFERVM